MTYKPVLEDASRLGNGLRLADNTRMASEEFIHGVAPSATFEPLPAGAGGATLGAFDLLGAARDYIELLASFRGLKESRELRQMAVTVSWAALRALKVNGPPFVGAELFEVHEGLWKYAGLTLNRDGYLRSNPEQVQRTFSVTRLPTSFRLERMSPIGPPSAVESAVQAANAIIIYGKCSEQGDLTELPEKPPPGI